MNDEDISTLLWRLENGEVSEDESDLDEDALDYYDNVGELQADLERENQILEEILTENDGTAPDPPLIFDELVENQPHSNATPSLRDLIWKKKNLDLVDQAFTFLGCTDYPPIIMNLSTPYQYFSYFFDESLLARIVTESNKYAIQKNINFSEPMTVLELRKYIGILIYTSVYHYPSIRSYWANNVRFHPIADTMTVNRFEKIREILHFNDNEGHLPREHPEHDRLHKIRTIVDHLNQRFMSVPFDHRLSLDEQMCATKISHFMKQYLPNKPHKWGFKLYVLCCLMGYAYSFEIYSGTHDYKRLPSEPNLGAVSNTVVRLLRPVPRKVNHIVYFDNFYSSLTLFHHLHKEGIYCLGTVQRNRLGKTCKLPKKEDVQKTSVPRGSYDENVASLDGVEFAATSWKDNKQVLLLSTYVGANPVGTISRYDKKQKKNISIPCPKVIEEYNAHMGGVDTMDSYLGRYRIRMKSKKWTNRLFQHMLDMAVINSWILYKKVSLKKKTNPKNILKLVDFRTELAETLCKYGAVSENKRGRPSMNRQENTSKKRPKIGAQTLPPNDVRTDGVGHDKSYNTKRNQCKYANCKKLTSVMCTKCKISLCDNRKNNCFQVFHAM
ncbi:unnamed protein product [Parnassius mnemosyne]|uniref:PiggyBac transposable element-derived protein domain-containing protein n=1 Tax=Parnassius mnemosyne TaxID=213953 RepID=A0AAV1L180_9NEOP